MDMNQIPEQVFVDHMAMIFTTVSELVANTYDGMRADEYQDRMIWAGSKALDNMWRHYEQMF